MSSNLTMFPALSYHAIEKPASAVLKERGSKFLGFAYPVESEKEIRECLILLKKEHPSASHHCYAWRLGADKRMYRANDDGEPANSAGKPILSAIQAHDLSNILIVVVRYFGGTLLGVNGLINAYKDAANNVIDHAIVFERFVLSVYRVEFGMEDMNHVMRILKENDAKIITSNYENGNIITFHVQKQKAATMEARFNVLYAVDLKFLQFN